MLTTTHKKLTAALVVAVALAALFIPGQAMAQQEGFLGEVKMFAGNFAPRGWALCNGQILPISQNQALFSILGTIYGGDGRTTFALPDLRGRVAVSAGQGAGLSNYRLGQRGGAEQVTLSQTQMPSHSHSSSLSVPASSNAGSQAAPGSPAAGRNFYSTATNTALPASLTINNTGGSQPHTNIQPFETVNYIICIQGVFPSRN